MLHDLTTTIIKEKGLIISPGVVHDVLDKVMCKPCYRILSKYSMAIEAIKPLRCRLQGLLDVS